MGKVNVVLVSNNCLVLEWKEGNVVLNSLLRLKKSRIVVEDGLVVSNRLKGCILIWVRYLNFEIVYYF